MIIFIKRYALLISLIFINSSLMGLTMDEIVKQGPSAPAKSRTWKDIASYAAGYPITLIKPLIEDAPSFYQLNKDWNWKKSFQQYPFDVLQGATMVVGLARAADNSPLIPIANDIARILNKLRNAYIIMSETGRAVSFTNAGPRIVGYATVLYFIGSFPVTNALDATNLQCQVDGSAQCIGDHCLVDQCPANLEPSGGPAALTDTAFLQPQTSKDGIWGRYLSAQGEPISEPFKIEEVSEKPGG